jgi:hypothetical protein
VVQSATLRQDVRYRIGRGVCGNAFNNQLEVNVAMDPAREAQEKNQGETFDESKEIKMCESNT